MSYYKLMRHLLFCFDAEDAHRMAIAALKVAPLPSSHEFDPILASSVAGLRFPSPVGLAAGFDKNAEVAGKLLVLGFGFVEVGSLTPRAQPGNARPRLFRLGEDEAVINRMGFNNRGHDDAEQRLSRRSGTKGLVGVNLGANKDSEDRIADYAVGVRRFARHADYLAINISSPNTPGLRGLQQSDVLEDLLAAVHDARGDAGPPIFLKLAPDLSIGELDAVAAVVVGKVDALIMGNTTLARPGLRSRHANETGGLSGKPLAPIAREALVNLRKATGAAIPLIAVGGIDSAEEAYARIRAGASLVQIYSAMIYQGPALGKRIADGLAVLLRRDGFENLAQAVGVDG